MKKKSITHEDMLDAELIKIKRELLLLPIAHGAIWESPDSNSLCGLLLYIPLDKKYGEKILEIIRE